MTNQNLDTNLNNLNWIKNKDFLAEVSTDPRLTVGRMKKELLKNLYEDEGFKYYD